jgi:putative transposase
LDETLDAAVVVPRRPLKTHLCLDGGYNSKKVRESLLRRKIHEHIRNRKEEIERKRRFRAKPRRWKVERAHSWMNRYRRLLVRWEKQAASYLAMVHLACASICFRRLRL